MTQSNHKTLVWPPIIADADRSIFLKLRDYALTVLGWFFLADLLQDFWILVYDWLKPPIFILAPENMPDWADLWEVFHPFVFVSGAIMAGTVMIAIWRRKIISRTIEHYYLTPDDEADLIYRQAGLLPSQVQKWHRLRNVDIHLDDKGNILEVVNKN